ncbi:uncharacterized protein LOC135370746 [Ornithodoros turicata]|uniref:uncharacterized protein LOC135370746 n=1 Tax=Ornithodoros turicata TaxID=34597 RepID=UPI003139397B
MKPHQRQSRSNMDVSNKQSPLRPGTHPLEPDGSPCPVRGSLPQTPRDSGAPHGLKRAPQQRSHSPHQGTRRLEPDGSPCPVKGSLPQTPRDSGAPHRLKGAPQQRSHSPHLGITSPASPGNIHRDSPLRFKKYVWPAPEGFGSPASPSPDAIQLTPSVTPATSEQASRTTSKPLSRSPERRNMAYAIVVLAVIVGALLLVVVTKPFASPQIKACRTETCNKFAAIVALVNNSGDPCENFYRYVCDSWQGQDDKSVRKDQLNLYIRYTLESASRIVIPTSGQTGDQKAVSFYKSCRDVIDEKRNQVPEIKKIMHEANLTWPHFTEHHSLFEAMFCSERTLEMPLLIDIKSNSNSTHSIVTFSTPGNLKHVLVGREKLMKRGDYSDFLAVLIKHFAVPTKSPITATEQRDIEKKVHLSSLHVALSSPASTTTANLTYNLSEVRWPGYDQDRWKKAFAEHLGIPVDVNGVQIIIVEDAYIRLLRLTLQDVGESALQFLAGYLMALHTSEFANIELMQNYKRLSEQGTRDAAISHFIALCKDVVMYYMGSGYIHPHVLNWPTAEEMREIVDIAGNVENSFRAKYNVVSSVRLVDSARDFIDKQRRLDMKEIYKNYSDMGPDFVKNLRAAISGFRNSRRENIRLPYMNIMDFKDSPLFYLNKDEEELYFYPYAFVFPMYDVHGPLVSKYAGIGAGLSYGYAKIALSDQFQMNVTCMTDANPHMDVPTKNMFIRSLAVEEAWSSFKRADTGDDANRLKVSAFSEDQLFFVFFCHPLCRTDNKWEAACNVPLRFSATFSTVFACPETSLMRADPLCVSSQAVH